MTYEIIDDFLEKEDFDFITSTFFPEDLNNLNNFKVPHRVALFYVTTSNGFTVLKDTTQVQCIENRMLLFDGSIEHHSVTSTDNPRCLININYLDNN